MSESMIQMQRKLADVTSRLEKAERELAVPNLVESHQIKAPDCRTCANRGRVNGLSQESYCEGCVYQNRDWRQNHFVDASTKGSAASVI